ncbi:hypothetical protein LX69_01878 [Breznakibacter xylanolyticus]|uniref:TIGR01777 family protein n=1 Tax=Breznakibacter xylanolyticus TaxID=990 RepID=A0A2W7NI82_9BACT|nr:TIGR01777 family oxidoreductase [Breznakibacter xylanolyticus]PZX16384.1 hypothetical protein LX69_01878 [Breznakibacter xylanolyticus]
MTATPPPQKTIAITGATGFIGQSLSAFFIQNGYRVVAITRKDIKAGAKHVAEKMESVQAIFNLAGATIQKRWTPTYKQEIVNSRILTTRTLSQAIALMTQKPEVFISTSAVGIYNHIDIHDEFSEQYDHSFLAEVCQQWEAEAMTVLTHTQVRLVIFRLGVVLGRQGGAFPKMRRPFCFFLGGRMASGEQWFPFVHIKDVLSAFWFACNNTKAGGIYNLTAPQNITNRKFAQVLGKTLHRPSWLPVPQWMLKLLMGEAAILITQGQYVKAHRLPHDGFMFEYPTIEKAMKELVGK